FNLMALTFMFFRCRSLEDAGAMTSQIVNDFHLSVAPQFVEGYLLIVLAMLLGLFMHMSPRRWCDKLRDGFDAAPLVVQAVIFALVIVMIIQVRQSDIVPFIYLQY
ncbi:MAG: MBOAT family protein, partial [Duncaniella sp.]|nr:MBOAT family protein [Duncaniella sp.]